MTNRINQIAFILIAVWSFYSCEEEKKDERELTSIQQERQEMHSDFVKSSQHLNLKEKLQKLTKKKLHECTPKEAENRIQNAWRLGDVEQLKKDIPIYLKTDAFIRQSSGKADWRLIIHMWEHKPSEWARFTKMSDDLYTYFKQTGKIDAEQKLLGAKIQGAHLMGDTLNERKLLLQILKEIDSQDERYKTYYPMLGWWYQDHGQWANSIPIFKDQYKKTGSINMLSSLVWGYFNNHQFDDVLMHENEILKLKEKKVYFILAKSYEELGNDDRANYYYEKFRGQNYMGSNVVFYFTNRNDNKFFTSDESYLIDVAEYFSQNDLAYSCRLNQHNFEMIYGSLTSEYAISLERKVIIAQYETDKQEFQSERYRAKRKFLFNKLRTLRKKCQDCDNKGLITFSDKIIRSNDHD